MNREMLDILNDLSKKQTTGLALKIMELSSENLILEQQCKKQKEAIDKAIEYIKEKQKIQYKFALSHIECDDLLQILEEL